MAVKNTESGEVHQGYKGVIQVAVLTLMITQITG